MKRLIAVLGCMASLFPFAMGQTNDPSHSNVGQQILQIEQELLNAQSVPDLPAMRKLIADNFMGTAFGPKILSKQDIVPPDGTQADHMPKCSLVDPTVRIFGDTAVLMGRLQPEDPKEGGFSVTTVFHKQVQGWQIIAIHMSPAQQ